MALPTSFPKEKIKVLLLENIHDSAVELFSQEGFQIEQVKGALKEDELVARLPGVHVLGLRSKTHVTDKALAAGKQLLSVGCFCIGTNQVDLSGANARAVPVFNAPYSNTRSVAELVISEVIALSRQLMDRSKEVHQGIWKKAADGCNEVRGKTIGIVGYGHIGTQVGLLAESFGMRVLFVDVAAKLPLGNARVCGSLDELLSQADFVTMHVPATPETHLMIRAGQLARMKKGAHLLNLSRGTVVDIPALAASIREGHLGGAAVDVYPEEPEGNGPGFVTELQGLPNVILTPHVGGSTSEAQEAIGREVATTLIKYVTLGVTTGAVNFPNIELPPAPKAHRVLNVHRNVPGVLSDVNHIVSELGANIERQVLATDANVGYLVMDLNADVSEEVRRRISELPTNLRTRVLW